MSLSYCYRAESFPLKEPFRIARGVRTEAMVVVVDIQDQQGHVGRGESVPYLRYQETIESVLQQIATVLGFYPNGKGLTRRHLHQNMAAGAARNALDCALWDLEIKQIRNTDPDRSFAHYANLADPRPVTTVQTISLDRCDLMARASAKAATKLGSKCFLKIKLGGKDGLDGHRLRSIRAVVPEARLIVDVNEGWQIEELSSYLDVARQVNVEMVEQPLPADQDQALSNPDLIEKRQGLLIGADESIHTCHSLPRLVGVYDMVNIKLDKTGGLTEAFELLSEAQTQGFEIMVGCMMSTSLSMAPAFWLAQQARYVDLDGPLWLAQDRPNGLTFKGGMISAPDPLLWG